MAETGWQSDGTYVPCPECEWAPRIERNPSPGIPIRMPGTIHHGDCPTIPRLTPEEEQELRKALDEMDRARRRGWAEARNYVIG